MANQDITGHSVPFTGEFTPFPYWQCLPAHGIIFSCEPRSEDEGGEKMAGIDIEIDSPNGYEGYGGRHSVSLEVCFEMVKLWHSLTAKEAYVCVSGQYIGTEEKVIRGKRQFGRAWIYDKLKTKKGCASWFEGDCQYRSQN